MSEAVSEDGTGVAHVRKQLEEERWGVSVASCKPDDGAVMAMILVSRTHVKVCCCGFSAVSACCLNRPNENTDM